MQLNTDDPLTRYLYKGKVAHRSWPQLPEEIVRLIATHYLWDIAGTNYCPQSLDTRKLWYSRLVYTCVRDTHDIERNLMSICPEWRRAIEKHPFWNQAMHVLDPNDSLIFHMTIHPKPQLNGSSNTTLGVIHLTPYQHFRNILNSSCLVCRLNNPLSNNGLTIGKKYATTITLGVIPVCREHNHRRNIFCGACLRHEPISHHPDRIVREQDLVHSLGVLENEDEDTWPHIEATCRRCRSEWLWRKACTSGFPHDREAIGGPSFQCPDWETKQNVEGFIELAEGNIADLLTLAREKWWLRMNTKYDSLGQHLLAAQRTEHRHGHDSHHEMLDVELEAEDEDEEEEEEEEEEDSEEGKEFMLMRGANQVRDLALQDWARHRILDGHWVSPADVWYNLAVPGQSLVVPTVHPCPWSREMDGSSSSASMDASSSSNAAVTPGGAAAGAEQEEETHPLKTTIAGDVPPSFALCELAYGAHIKQFREIVGPAMRNIVRKIVMESSVPTVTSTENGYVYVYGDPALIARKMSLETVVKILREEEGVWFDGVDWIEKKRNEEEERAAAAAAASAGSVGSRRRHVGLDLESSASSSPDDYDSTSSSSSSRGGSNVFSSSSTHGGSSSSNATSPVLSTSTVQTTPSPCPLSGEESSLSSSSSTIVRGPESGVGVGNDDTEKNGKSRGRPSQAPPPQLQLPRPRPMVIPVDPVRSTPRLLSKVPYVPTTTQHLPQYSIEAIRAAWREAIAPLYQCGCRICERARFAELMSYNPRSGGSAPTYAVPVPVPVTAAVAVPPSPSSTSLTKSHTRSSFIHDVDESINISNSANISANLAAAVEDFEGIGDVDVGDQSDFDEEDEDLDDDEQDEDLDDEDLEEGVDYDNESVGVEGYQEGYGDGMDSVLYPQSHSPDEEAENETETYRSHGPPGSRVYTEPKTGKGAKETEAETEKDRNPKTKVAVFSSPSGPRPLKRSSDELEDASEDVPLRLPLSQQGSGGGHDKRGSISPTSSNSWTQHQHSDRRDQEGIPAKRARIGERFPSRDGDGHAAADVNPPPLVVSPSVSPTTADGVTPPPAAGAVPIPLAANPGPVRQRKRSNEELDEGVPDEWERTGPNKRARMDRAPSPPSPSTLSLSLPSPSPLNVNVNPSVSVPRDTPRGFYPTVDVDVNEEEKRRIYLPVGDEKEGQEDKSHVPPRPRTRNGNGTGTGTRGLPALRVRGICQSDMDKLIPMDDVDE